ncbi:epidermal retinal dehydrogenase 2 [Capsaspora owczarzaki ATCC 30864]|uniref:Epidermal retinal dehydrogenase 2 n=1 Tax=Capsaspora owczarzaki (strain ATCC 30864) TaxID=595528 RepID=A0A0D2WV69_CAPO3|nr:epidermal retinal dehydrogenase 2 [Capsaspora owczarzaki ATCC 30864]KJE96023.1 epidermal retinal dehydrogenase 2 [Capsaspora owczarzaki ATCC 30864]|eukprot:XP_004345146.1 epidermal retinal dehydrogenase 2 [Capsaspora owczarzaki ATCC 30864]
MSALQELAAIAVDVIRILGLLVLGWFRFFFPTRKPVDGEIALITGAGSGLGRLLALELAKLRATLVLVDVNFEAVQAVAAEIRALRPDDKAAAFAYKCDLSSRDDVYAMAARVKSEVGQVSILVNNAGIVTGRKLLDCPDPLIEKTFSVNTTAHFWTVKAFLPAMIESNHGHVVTIASSAGLIGVAGLADYCASKHGAVGLDESLRYEMHKLGKTGVKTTVVCPFFIDTGMFEGVTTRFPLILPILKPDYAVAKILDAILTNQSILCMPRFVYLMPFAKSILPTQAMDAVVRLFGVSNSMDDFHGRSSANSTTATASKGRTDVKSH